jgi:hypothetical protein
MKAESAAAAPSAQTSLSWDVNPARIPWSAQLSASVAADKARLDLGNSEDVAPGYSGLAMPMQIKYWVEMMVRIAKWESDWDPSCVFHEPAPLNEDSVGLLQLSYSDQAVYKFAPPIVEANGSLLDPLTNLRCGVEIMATLVSKDKVVSQTVGTTQEGAARYWSTMRPAGHLADVLAHARQSVGL